MKLTGELKFLFKTKMKIEFYISFKTEIEDKYSDTIKIVLSFQIG